MKLHYTIPCVVALFAGCAQVPVSCDGCNVESRTAYAVSTPSVCNDYPVTYRVQVPAEKGKVLSVDQPNVTLAGGVVSPTGVGLNPCAPLPPRYYTASVNPWWSTPAFLAYNGVVPVYPHFGVGFADRSGPYFYWSGAYGWRRGVYFPEYHYYGSAYGY